MSRTVLAFAAAAASLALAGAALAQPAAPAAKPAASTADLQGDQSAWINDPHMHAFYDLAVQAFANGVAQVDEAAFRTRSYAIFADFGASHGMKPEAMVDHLKLIPGQVVKIAREDPDVLKTYPNFVAALFGPQ